MPEIDDWDYDEWADASQRALRYERPSQKTSAYGLPSQSTPNKTQRSYKSAQSFEFISLDPRELRLSQETARKAWEQYRSDIEAQIEDYFSPKPDADERATLAIWEKISPVLIVYGVPPQ